jgi:hypothetical protein
VVVNNTPRPVSDDSAAVIERQRIQVSQTLRLEPSDFPQDILFSSIIHSWNLKDTAEGMLRSVLMKIFEIAGGAIDHVPPVMYEFEISCTKKVDDRENVYSRVANMPSLINLSN